MSFEFTIGESSAKDCDLDAEPQEVVPGRRTISQKVRRAGLLGWCQIGPAPRQGNSHIALPMMALCVRSIAHRQARQARCEPSRTGIGSRLRRNQMSNPQLPRPATPTGAGLLVSAPVTISPAAMRRVVQSE
jgi:hypothetical protein